MKSQKQPSKSRDRASKLAAEHLHRIHHVEKATGTPLRREAAIIHAFVEGYDSGCIDSDKGELLDVANELQSRFYDLDQGQKRIINLEELLRAVILNVDHENDCECDICVAADKCLIASDIAKYGVWPCKKPLADEQKVKITELEAEIIRLNETILRDPQTNEILESSWRPCEDCNAIKPITYSRTWCKAEPVGRIHAICNECAQTYGAG